MPRLSYSMSVTAGVAGHISDFTDQIPFAANVVAKPFVDAPRYALESVNRLGPIASKLLTGHSLQSFGNIPKTG